jgi:hypothetical protein
MIVHQSGLRRICSYKYMSVYKNRMIRFMYKDIYLPIHCYASKKQFYSLVGECACMTECKFRSKSSRGSKQTQDYQNSEPEKDRV